MNRFYILLVLCIILIAGIGLAGCESAPDRRFETTVRSVQDAKYNLQVRALTRDELKERAGRIQSPFISLSRVIDTREFVVFEVVIKNKTEIPARLDLRNMQLSTGTTLYTPRNAFQMKRFWDQYDSIETSDRARMDNMIDQYMFDREINVPANGLKRGWVVFNAALPSFGEMKLTFPLFGQGFTPDLYEFSFPYTNFK